MQTGMKVRGFSAIVVAGLAVFLTCHIELPHDRQVLIDYCLN